MPRKKELEPLLEVKIRLYASDYERLKLLYPQAGPARVIRAIVHTHVAKIVAQTPASAEPELDFEIEESDLVGA